MSNEFKTNIFDLWSQKKKKKSKVSLDWMFWVCAPSMVSYGKFCCSSFLQIKDNYLQTLNLNLLRFQRWKQANSDFIIPNLDIYLIIVFPFHASLERLELIIIDPFELMNLQSQTIYWNKMRKNAKLTRHWCKFRNTNRQPFLAKFQCKSMNAIDRFGCCCS